MKAITVFLLALSLSICSAQEVYNGVSVIVNDNIITKHDIDTLTLNTKDASTAQETLIQKELLNSEYAKQGISVSQEQIQAHIANLAAARSMSLSQFRQSVLTQMSWKTYLDEIRKVMQNEQLIQGVIAKYVQSKEDTEFRKYYERNKNQFASYEKIEVVTYTATNQRLLEQVIQNPMFANKDLVTKQETFSAQNTANQNLYAYLGSIDEKKFSQIIPNGAQFLLFFVSKKSGFLAQPYEKVAQLVRNAYAQEHQQSILDEYILALKAKAHIEYVR